TETKTNEKEREKEKEQVNDDKANNEKKANKSETETSHSNPITNANNVNESDVAKVVPRANKNGLDVIQTNNDTNNNNKNASGKGNDCSGTKGSTAKNPTKGTKLGPVPVKRPFTCLTTDDKESDIFEVKLIEITDNGNEKPITKFVSGWDMNSVMDEMFASYPPQRVRIARISVQATL
ncbi:DUF1325 family protein, partial [Reticulomyxa filosa]